MPNSYTYNNSPAESSKHLLHELLPEYATILALGETPQAQFAPLEEHLAKCAECQVDLDELLELTIAAYTERLEPALEYPRPDLSFLQPAALPRSFAQMWRLEEDTLVITLSALILQAAQQQSLAGVLRGRLLYRYVQEPRSVADLEVSIDVYAEESRPGQGRVRVSVEVPSRDPMEQAGSLVVLRADQLRLDGRTDELGCVDFSPVPLVALPHMRVEITPLGGVAK
jgi:anti-sigma factor RsiW